MCKLYTIDEIKKIAVPIAMRYGVDKMFLFGSYARGEARPDSDLDFRIDRGKVKDLFSWGGLYADLEESFNLPIDLCMSDGLDDKFRGEITPEEILIYDNKG